MMLRSPDGATYVAGLVRADAACSRDPAAPDAGQTKLTIVARRRSTPRGRTSAQHGAAS